MWTDPSRPVGEATIFRHYQTYSNGFVTYSEGCNDDVNKFVWSGLGWNPDADVKDILRDYSRFFVGPNTAESFARTRYSRLMSCAVCT